MLYREHKTQDVKRGKLNEEQAEEEKENDEKQEKRVEWMRGVGKRRRMNGTEMRIRSEI
jgi:hypothetical protein